MSLTPNNISNQTHIFVYGTLKQGFPNHYLLESFKTSKDAVLLGPCKTLEAFPLVCGPLGIPFLINKPGSGHRVMGELYSVSGRALDRLDELEGLSRGHYERLPIKVAAEEEDEVVIEAEAYFGHRSFGEDLWEKCGRVGLEEYLLSHGDEYVRVEDREVGLNLGDYVKVFIQGDGARK